MSVFHAKAVWDNAELSKTDPFIQMSCMDITLDNCVKLKNGKADFLCLRDTIHYQLFADMLTSALSTYRVACVTNMSAAPHVIRVQDV